MRDEAIHNRRDASGGATHFHTTREMAVLLGLATAQGARSFIDRHGIPYLRRGRSIVINKGTWRELVELAEESDGDWREAVRRLKRRRREQRHKRNQ